MRSVMSLYCLVGLNIPISSLLLQQVSAIELFESKSSFCNVCKKIKPSKLFILINNRHPGYQQEDIYLICSECKRRKDKVKRQKFISHNMLIKILTILTDSSLTKEALPLIDKIINNLKEKFKKVNENPTQIIEKINSKLLGWGWDETDILGYQKCPRKTWQLLQEFYYDLARSYVVRYYRRITSFSFKLEELLGHFCKRQTNFKLRILNQMVSISEKINNLTDISNWLKKGLEGIDQFQFALAATDSEIDNVLLSICKKSVQFRRICDKPYQQAKSRLIITETPMNKRPFIFKISTFGHQDEVEIGLYQASKNQDGSYLQANTPLLFRFKVMIYYNQSEASENNAFENNNQQYISSRKNNKKCTGKKRILRKKRSNKQQQTIQIEDDDVLCVQNSKQGYFGTIGGIYHKCRIFLQLYNFSMHSFDWSQNIGLKFGLLIYIFFSQSGDMEIERLKVWAIKKFTYLTFSSPEKYH